MPLLSTLLAASALAVSQSPAAPQDTSYKVGRLTVAFPPASGLRLDFDDTRASLGSRVRVSTFKRGERSGDGVAPAGLSVKSHGTKDTTAGGRVIRVIQEAVIKNPASADNPLGTVDVDQQVELRPDNTVTLRLEAMARASVAVVLDWIALELPEPPIAGARWRAEGVDYTDTNGLIAVSPAADAKEPALISKAFWTLGLEGKPFRLRIAPGQESVDARFEDVRAIAVEQKAGPGERRPGFLIGFRDLVMAPGQKVVRTLRLVFTPAPSPAQ
jgi:hypothetical protein